MLLSSTPRWLCTNEQRYLYLSYTSEYKFHPVMKGTEVLFIIFIATSLDQATFHSYFPLLSWTLSSTRAQNDLLKTKRVCQTPVQYCLQPHDSHRAKPGRVTRSHPVSALPSSFLLYAKYISHLGALCTASYHLLEHSSHSQPHWAPQMSFWMKCTF